MRLLTLRTILVATDFDEASNPALRTAARLAPLAGAGLYLLYVEERSRGGDTTRLKEHYRNVIPDAPEPDGVDVIAGFPASVILMHAIAIGADAVILGPHRDPGAKRKLGSTAARVVRQAPCPCLVSPTELHLPLQRVLAPLDLSQVAPDSLAVALSWASALRPRGGEAKLTALHLTPLTPSSEVEEKVHGDVRQACTYASGAACVSIRERVVRFDDPVAGILQTATAERVDLLVMGTRSRAGGASDLGSVAAAVARETPCPLLLVPPTWVHGRERD